MALSHVHHQHPKNRLTLPQELSSIYHDCFDYSLSNLELKKWQVVNQNIALKKAQKTNSKEKFKRKQLRRKISEEKLLIAVKAANLLSKIPIVKFIGITGSLAMMNSGLGSDIDFLIITKTNTLWLTRPIVYFVLYLSKISVRKPGGREERDRLCINMWMDEGDLKFNKAESHLKNLFLAHEVLQINPLINKNKTFERLLSENKWVYEYWKGNYEKTKLPTYKPIFFLTTLNLIAYLFQKLYMKKKLTREVVTPARAFFHPIDWGKRVEKELIKRGVKELNLSSPPGEGRA